MPPVGLLIADRYPVFRAGLARAAETSAALELIGVAADGTEALEAIRRSEPDVALLDRRLPGLSGAEVLEAARRDALATRVLLLADAAQPAQIHRADALGANGVVVREWPEAEILAAVLAAAAAGADHFVGPPAPARNGRPSLSPRELEVLVLVADGLSAPEIGRRLHLAVGTVKTHLQNLYEKFGVSDRAAAVATALRGGFIE